MDEKKIAVVALLTACVVIAAYWVFFHKTEKYTVDSRRMKELMPMDTQSKRMMMGDKLSFGWDQSADRDFNTQNLMPTTSVSAEEGSQMRLTPHEVLRSVQPSVQSYYGLYPEHNFQSLTFVA